MADLVAFIRLPIARCHWVALRGADKASEGGAAPFFNGLDATDTMTAAFK